MYLGHEIYDEGEFLVYPNNAVPRVACAIRVDLGMRVFIYFPNF